MKYYEIEITSDPYFDKHWLVLPCVIDGVAAEVRSQVQEPKEDIPEEHVYVHNKDKGILSILSCGDKVGLNLRPSKGNGLPKWYFPVDTDIKILN